MNFTNLDHTEMKMLAGLMSKINWANFATALRRAKTTPSKKQTAVLFDYVYSGVHEPIAMIEKINGMQISVEDALKNPMIYAVLKKTFCMDNGNIMWYTRRKMDYTKPEAEQITHIRQMVVTFEPYALHPMGRPCPYPEDE